MNKISYPLKPDLLKFAAKANEQEAKYGLPGEVKFCKCCVISNQRPNSTAEHKHTKESKKSTIVFDAEGICDACHFAEKKKSIDWQQREAELKTLCNKYRRSDGYYDCLVPGSGGKDSFYAAHMLKYKYGMNPLTVTWAPHIYTDWGWHNQQAWIHAGFDNQLITPNGLVHRLLTRLATEIILHPFQPFIIGQKFLVPRIAAQLKIPLVFYGENEAEYGNPGEQNDKAEREWKYYTQSSAENIFISGVSLADLKGKFGLTDHDLYLYMPADPQNLKDAGLNVQYLGYYLKWHPQSCYYYTIENSDFIASPERNPGTYSKYASLDDKLDDLNFYTLGIKFGIGRATYDAAQEVRAADITREEGVALVKRFDHEFPERFAEEIFRYLSIPANKFPIASKMFEQPLMDRAYFDKLVDNFRSPHLWKHENGKWQLRHAVWQEAA